MKHNYTLIYHSDMLVHGTHADILYTVQIYCICIYVYNCIYMYIYLPLLKLNMLLSALYRMVPSSSFRSRAVFTVDLTKEPSSLEAESQEHMKQ